MLRRVTDTIIFATMSLVFIEVKSVPKSLFSHQKIFKKPQETKTTNQDYPEFPGKIVNMGDKLFYYSL